MIPVARLALLAALSTVSAVVHAQASAVSLQIRPRAGDTLRLRMDQSVEMEGTTRKGASDVTSVEQHTLVVLSRISIESTDLDGATVTAFTDSVRLTSSDNLKPNALLGWAHSMQGQRFRFRVALDGSTSLAGGDPASTPQVGSFLAQMPATLPREPIAPGATWTRTMEIPLSAGADNRGFATMTAAFHFDSLGRSGDLAYLSLTGRLTRTASPPKGSDAPTVEMAGTVSGTVLVDRRRGWITDARTLINVHSLVQPAKRGFPPVKVRMRITQWMRAQ